MSDCLTEVDFEQFDSGDTTDAELERISDHISSCDACRVAYERFQKDESFLAGARSVLDDEDEFTIPDIPRRREFSTKDFTFEKAPRLELSKHLPNIDGYKIVDVIGHGGMGVVYRAVQLKLNRTVALKVLPSMIGAANPAAVERFQREANAAARLHHTHIIPIYDFGESHDAHYYAMELIHGQPLSVLVRQFAQKNAASASPARLAEMLRDTTYESPDTGRSQPYLMSDIDESRVTMATQGFGRGRVYYRQVARWMADAAHALQYAHGQRIIHRDIKPANLILSVDGRIMIADFGLAKTEDEHSVTVTGALLGTIRYCSPEQAMARRIPIDHRTDIYSLGATMYELLCFQPAYPGDDDKKVLAAIMTRDPVPPRKIVPHVPAELETICLKAMERAPDARYLTARAFAEDLERYTKDLPIVAKRPPFHKRAIKFVRRHRAATTAVTAGFLVVVMSVAVYLSNVKQRELRVQNYLKDYRRETNTNYDYDKAIDVIVAALDLRPDMLELNYNYAIALKEKYKRGKGDVKHLERSLEYCDRSLAIAPSHPRPANLKAAVLYLLKRYEEAEAVCRPAIEERDPWAASSLVKILSLQRRIEDADAMSRTAARFAEDRRKEIERDTKNVDRRPGEFKALGSLWRTVATVQLFIGDLEFAKSAMKKARDLDPDNPGTHLMEARLLLAHDDNNEGDRADLVTAANNARKGLSKKKYDVNDVRFTGTLLQAMLRDDKNDLVIGIFNDLAIADNDIPVDHHLIVAIAHARLAIECASEDEPDIAQSHIAAAQDDLRQANAKWPDELREPGQYDVNADREILWFQTADELLALRAEAVGLLDQATDNPQNR